MKYDWDKEWYEGHLPADRRSWWKKHPLEAGLTLLLAVAVMLLWGVS